MLELAHEVARHALDLTAAGFAQDPAAGGEDDETSELRTKQQADSEADSAGRDGYEVRLVAKRDLCLVAHVLDEVANLLDAFTQHRCCVLGHRLNLLGFLLRSLRLVHV